MAKIADFFKNKYVIGFGAGVAASVIGYQVLKSKTFKKAAVKTVAYGMKIREDAKCAVNEIKEEAEDVCASAHAEALAGAQAGESAAAAKA
jgi:hypothetical protein